MDQRLVGRSGLAAPRRKKTHASAASTSDALKAQIARHKARVATSTLILSTAWIASALWTYNGILLTAEETATANFTGAIQAVIAAIVCAVVVAGASSMLLKFCGEGGDHE